MVDSFEDLQQIYMALTPVAGVLAMTQLISLYCLHVATQTDVSKCWARDLSHLKEQGAVTPWPAVEAGEPKHGFVISDVIQY